jgi:RNA-directed DNA polymerase
LPNYQHDYIQALTERFGEPVDSVDLTHPVAYASNLIERDLPVLFDLRHLAHVTGVSVSVLGLMLRNPGKFYSRFVIRKRTGGSREIAAPTPELKRVQQWVNRRIAQKLPMHDAAHGFRPARSIVSNAQLHVGAEVILCLDIRDFFHAVRAGSVYTELRSAGYSTRISHALTDLVTVDGHLPQGAPTSPALANVAARRLDKRLDGYCKKRGVTYSRYADDLAFSGSRAAIHGSPFKRTVELILRDSGFPPQEKKERYMDDVVRQQVTGLVVNERPNAPRDRRRWIRQELYYLERFGIEEHLAARGSDRPNYRAYIYGHVVALFASNREEAGAYLARLDRLAW